MRFARRLLIFSYGLFSIAAQTLLFREFITTFEGNDISVGIFFGSWFLWVGLGAVLVYRAKTIAEKLLPAIEFLFLAYLPAFILELILIIQARELAGIESYALWSVKAMVLLSILVNAPVSIITGMFFPIACRWAGSQSANGKWQIASGDKRFAGGAVSRVYILEAAGSLVGGLGVTILLGIGVSLARIFFILAFIVSLAAFFVQLAKGLTQHGSRKIACTLSFLIPLSMLLCLAIGADKALMRYVRIVKWTKLLGKQALTGSFQTAQAEYLYGTYHGQWVAVREGSVVEALPDESTTGRIAALTLCQNPGAKRTLVIGSGIGLCRQFLQLPQIETVTWAHCDSEYVRQVNKFIPQEFNITDKRFCRTDFDVRSLLAEKRQYYDIVILNLPDATSSVLNRYYTLEFYRRIKKSLGPDGILAVRIAGGENIMGTELINLGASTKLTLQAVFSQLVLTPGEDTWFIASDSENLSGAPGILRDRFAAIEGADRLFSPQALFSVYLPDRAAAALDNYSSADLPQDLLINRDSKPLTHLYSLLLAAKQSGAPITKFVKHLALAGISAFFIPVLVFIALRAIYTLSLKVRASSVENRASSFDSSFLVFSAGCAAIGVVIVLMYLYQTRFGSLYLHIGVISSLFMVGLTAGAVLISTLVTRRSWLDPHLTANNIRAANEILLFAIIFIHTLILAAIAFWSAGQWGHLTFAAAFILCGMCAGSYFPLAARQLADSSFEVGQAGSKLETADHLGASAGGLLTALILVPLLGTRLTLFVFILLIGANVPLAAIRTYKREKVYSLPTAVFRLRRLGYILFGIGISVVLCSNLLAAAGLRLKPSLPQHAAAVLAGQSRIEQQSTIADDNTRKFNYFKVYDTGESESRLPLYQSDTGPALYQSDTGPALYQSDTGLPSSPSQTEKLIGYIFSSEDLSPELRGFGGKLNLAIYVDTAGKLINFHIIRSNETPSYLELLSRWRDSLSGHQLFQPKPFADVHTVTGATVSSKAILSALQSSGNRFAGQILGHKIVPRRSSLVARGTGNEGRVMNFLPDTPGLYLISAFVLTLIVIYRGGFWSRLAILCFNLVAVGIVLNAQYSTEQIATVLSLQSPAAGLSGAFLLVVGIPVMVIIFGNIYCGYICPFGAAQELLAYIIPDRFKQPSSAEEMRKARFVKYIVLFVFIIVFFLSRDRTTLAAEPLIKIFNLRFFTYDFQSSMLLIVGIALLGSVFYARFWCRYLCPVGAFLSLLNNLSILKRYLPAKRFGKCEFGLSPKDQMDCLYCDRCRYEAQGHKNTRAQERKGARILLPCVLIVAIFLSTVSVRRFLTVSAGLGQPAVSAPSGGQPRDIDLQRIRTMIEQKRLSDREAEFYKKVE